MEKTTVFDAIERMTSLLRAEERRKCTEYGLQTVHLQVLDYLSKCNRYSDTPAALSNYLGMTRGTVSQTLLLLEKKGFLKKSTDALDRRVIHLSLKEEGKLVLEKVKLTELYNKAFAFISEEAQGHYYETMLSLLNALQKSNNACTFGLCKTCHYFTEVENGLLCGLTREPLTDNESEKICQEHTVT